VTQAMRSLGWLEEWLDATVRSSDGPTVRFSSLFPFAGNTRLVPPPKTSWPPAVSSRLYLKGAKLVPLDVALGAFDENRYAVDGASGCLIPGGASAPFRVSLRSSVAVDRVSGSASEPHRVACLEFHPRAGMWGLLDIRDSQWETRVKAAFRLLADSGFGGERSRGWGRAAEPEFHGVTKLFPEVEQQGAWWLLSLYSPIAEDNVDWAQGEYVVQERGGWTDSPAGVGKKKHVRMVEEGSVLAAPGLCGQAVDVAPDGFAHPVYRSGFALAIPIALAGLQVVEPVVPVAVVAVPEEEPAVVEEVVPEEPLVQEESAAEQEPVVEEEPAVGEDHVVEESIAEEVSE